MIQPADSDRILHQMESELAAGRTRAKGAAHCMETIHRELPHYDWVGIYWLEGDTLQLGPFVGAPTDHTSIPVGRGVCGTAVAEEANQVIDDVRALDNYLACSLNVRSEIVVLIRDASGAILGQIDADGHAPGAFDGSDEAFLERVAALLATLPEGGA